LELYPCRCPLDPFTRLVKGWQICGLTRRSLVTWCFLPLLDFLPMLFFRGVFLEAFRARTWAYLVVFGAETSIPVELLFWAFPPLYSGPARVLSEPPCEGPRVSLLPVLELFRGPFFGDMNCHPCTHSVAFFSDMISVFPDSLYLVFALLVSTPYFSQYVRYIFVGFC